MELEIGSGGNKGNGLSTDAVFFPTLDVQCRGEALPFRGESFTRIFMTGTFEHFTYPDARRVLEESFRVLKPGGIIDLNVPDLIAFAELFMVVVNGSPWPRPWSAPEVGLKATGNIELDYVLSGFYGGQDRPGMVHQSGWTEGMLRKELSRVGFDTVTLYSRDQNQPGTHLSFRAVKSYEYCRAYTKATQDDVSRFYDAKVREHGDGLFQADDGSLDEYLQALTEEWSTLLDAGCGPVGILDRVRRLGKVGVGVDLSLECVMAATRKGLNVWQGNIEWLQFGNASFDVVTCLGSLEHTVDPVKGLKELCRVSRKYVVVLFPLWFEDANGPVSRHYLQESMPNIERWLHLDEWDRLVSEVGGVVALVERKVINGGRDVLYVLRKDS